MPKRPQTRKEEFWNSLSHLIGLLFCIVAIPFLLYDVFNEKNILPFVSVSAFGVGMILVYTFSTLYHYVQSEGLKLTFKKLDHISIYFLIAGTYTPLVIKYLDRSTALWFLSILWGIVGFGILYKLFFIQKFKWLSLLIYVGMGWMAIFIMQPLVAAVPLSVFSWIIAGGISYSIGVYFYVKSHVKYYHSIWHVFVLFGSIAHFISIYLSV